MSETNRRYWAAEPEPEKFASGLSQRVKDFRKSLEESGRSYRAARSVRAFYGWAPDGLGDTAQVKAAGKQGEVADLTTNDFAALVQQTVVMITSQRPTFKAVAANTDFSSMAQAQLADGLLEFYDRQFNLADREHEITLGGVLASEAWAVQGWDQTAGAEQGVEPVTLPNGEEGLKAINQGEPYLWTVPMWDCAYEAELPDPAAMRWFAFRRKFSRHDLAAAFPTYSDEILRAPPGDYTGEDWQDIDSKVLPGQNPISKRSNDMVTVWEFRHLPSPALPPGRLVRVLNARCVLYDSMREDAQGRMGAYPYDILHAERLVPEVVVGGIAGHSSHFDLLGLQESLDMVARMAATAAQAGGVTNMWSPPGDIPQVAEVASGMNFIVSVTRPEPIKGPQLDPQAVAFADMCIQRQRRRIGLNDVALGEPTKGMPASLAALLQAQAIQFHSRLQSSYQRLIEATRTGLLKLLKKFASAPRTAIIAGKANSWALKEWQSKDIEGVDRVVVEAINPLMRTQAGRMSFAELMLQHNLIRDPKQILTLIATGRLEPTYQPEEANNMRVDKEKEMLMRGVGPPPIDPVASLPNPANPSGFPVFVDDGQEHIWPMISDPHWSDIPQYLSVAQSPEGRSGPAGAAMVKAVTSLVQIKLLMWRSMDPALIAVQGGQPCPPQFAPPPMPPPTKGDGNGPVPNAGDAKPVKNPQLEGAPSIPLPKPPTNPITGERPPAPPLA